jgi:hypothetical protein
VLAHRRRKSPSQFAIGGENAFYTKPKVGLLTNYREGETGRMPVLRSGDPGDFEDGLSAVIRSKRTANETKSPLQGSDEA